MIIVKLMGGFGNQLFQYAAGRSLAIARNEDLMLDISYLNADTKGFYTKRNFELDQIHLKAKIASENELQKFKSGNIIKKILNKAKLSSQFVFNEFQANYISGFESLPKNVLLNGYWQSEKYFEKIKALLLKEISPKYEFADNGKLYLEKIIRASIQFKGFKR